jgi:hypothetical protein
MPLSFCKATLSQILSQAQIGIRRHPWGLSRTPKAAPRASEHEMRASQSDRACATELVQNQWRKKRPAE